LRAQLGFEPRERLLVTAAAPVGGCATAASDRALYYRGDGGAWSRLGWEQVIRVDREPAGRRLVITGLAAAGRPRAVIPCANAVTCLRRRWSGSPIPDCAPGKSCLPTAGPWPCRRGASRWPMRCCGSCSPRKAARAW